MTPRDTERSRTSTFTQQTRLAIFWLPFVGKWFFQAIEASRTFMNELRSAQVRGLRWFGGGVSSALGVCTAVCVLSASSIQAALTPVTIAQWNLNGSQAASTVDYSFLSTASSFTASSTGWTVNYPTTGGNTGGYLDLGGKKNDFVSATFSFNITANRASSLTTLTLDYVSLRNNVTGTLSWTYQIGTGSVISLGSFNLNSGTWSPISVDLSAINLTSGDQVFFVGTILSPLGGGNNGNDSQIGFDNFTVNAVPEPINYALGGFGVIVAVTGAGRFYLGRRRAATAT